MGGRPWTNADLDDVLGSLETMSLETIARRIGRTPETIYRYAKKRGIDLRQGTFTMQYIIKRSGFSASAVNRARAVLQAGVRRIAAGRKRGAWRFTDEEVERICQYLIAEAPLSTVAAPDVRRVVAKSNSARNEAAATERYPWLRVGGHAYEWTLLARETVSNGPRTHIVWLCRCSCERTVRKIRQGDLVSRKTTRCRSCYYDASRTAASARTADLAIFSAASTPPPPPVAVAA